MNHIILALRTMPLLQVSAWLLLENAVILVMAVGCGALFVRLFAKRRVSPPAPPMDRVEIALSISTLLLNTGVTILGLWLWRQGIVHFRPDTGFYAFLDVVVLMLVMDAAMYMLHRAGHIRWLYPIVHRTHHQYDNPRPLTLFVLNPAETLSFGILWLVVISLYSASWVGMSLYLTLNVIFGAIGHLGVEPLPDTWLRLPVLNYLATSTFHAQHHHDSSHNFGFYTLIWDHIFGTLSPRYEADFGRLAPEFSSQA